MRWPSVLVSVVIAAVAFLTIPSPGAQAKDALADVTEATQNGVAGATYTSPRFGYSVRWDERTWQLAGASSGSHEDLLELSIIGKGDAVILKGIEDYSGNPETCLAAHLEQYPERVSAENLPRPVHTPGTAAALFQWGPVRYIECRTIVPDEAVLVIIVAAYHYTDVFPYIDELLGTLHLPDATSATPRATATAP